MGLYHLFSLAISSLITQVDSSHQIPSISTMTWIPITKISTLIRTGSNHSWTTCTPNSTLNLNSTPVPWLHPVPTSIFISSSSSSLPRANSHALVFQLDSNLHPCSIHSLIGFSTRSNLHLELTNIFLPNSYSTMPSQIMSNPPVALIPVFVTTTG